MTSIEKTVQRTLVMGDIHGGLKALKQVMKRAEISQKDTLIFLGDYVDGWSESPQVLDFLIQLKQTHSCIFLRGNHDELLLHWLETSQHNDMWENHGGTATVKAYKNISENQKNAHIHFLKNLKNYYLDHQNRLFVHAGFTNLKGVTHEYFPKLLYWDRTLWEMALAFDTSITKDAIHYPPRLLLYKEIYIGHTPVTRIDKTVPIQKANIWNVDTGAAFKGPLTIMDIDTKKFWQSDLLMDLYPNEIGRN